jgi:hypothetical protein
LFLDELYRHYIPNKNEWKKYLEAAKRSILTRNTKFNPKKKSTPIRGSTDE